MRRPRRPRTRQQLAAAQRADFLGVRLHYRLTDGDLSVASERDLAVAAHREDRGRADRLELSGASELGENGFSGFSSLQINRRGKPGEPDSPDRAPLLAFRDRHENGADPHNPWRAGRAHRAHDRPRRLAGRGRGATARAAPAHPGGAPQGGSDAGRARNALHGGRADRPRHLALGNDQRAGGELRCSSSARS